MSLLAICLTLVGGTALAAGLRKNSVNSATVKNNSLTSADLANGKGVGGSDVVDGSLTAADLAQGSLTGADLAAAALTGANVPDGALSGAGLAPGTLGASSLGIGSVDSDAVLNNSIRGADIGADALTGSRLPAGAHSIDESSLDTVPSAELLRGRGADEFLSNVIYEVKSGRQAGTLLPDGTRRIVIGCKAGDFVISGGANATSNPLVESRRQGNQWVTRSDSNGFVGDFEARVLCMEHLTP
jgi:hypothetical protein